MAYFPVTPSGLRTDDPAVAGAVGAVGARPSWHDGWRDSWRSRLVCGVLLALALAGTVLVARSRTGGTFVYPVDDAYIHLAAAKKLVLGGDASLFSACSSIVWPWLLAGLRVVGVDDSAPLVLNGIAAIGLFALTDRALASLGVKRAAPAALGVLLMVPIVPLALSGMEHTSHTCFALLVVGLGVRAAVRNEKVSVGLALAAAATVAFRYEGAFVVGAVALLFARAKRPGSAALVMLAGALPAVVRGVLSVSRNGLFFPVPVTMKRTGLSADLIAKIYYRLIDNPHVLVLFILLAFAWTLDAGRTDREAKERHAFVLVAAITLAAQTALAQLGWFYRYEAYAVLLALVAVASTAAAHARRVKPFALAAAVIAFPLVGRAASAFRTTVLASQNIYDQEIQMALFVHTFANDSAVALNDIGAVSYFADAKVVDLVGLASPRIAAARGMRLDGPLPREVIARETTAANVRLAIVYDDWFVGTLPLTWRRIGTLKIPDNHVCAKDTVSFYATHE
ncbi:MAG: hypothetical protein ABI551_04240, partial [Polyangiaceae bacterium]